jgi:hypothetical protein
MSTGKSGNSFDESRCWIHGVGARVQRFGTPYQPDASAARLSWWECPQCLMAHVAPLPASEGRDPASAVCGYCDGPTVPSATPGQCRCTTGGCPAFQMEQTITDATFPALVFDGVTKENKATAVTIYPPAPAPATGETTTSRFDPECEDCCDPVTPCYRHGTGLPAASPCISVFANRACIHDAGHGGPHLSIDGFGNERRWLTGEANASPPEGAETGGAVPRLPDQLVALEQEFTENEADPYGWGWDHYNVGEVLRFARAYRARLHDVETRCDPAGDVQRIASLEEQVAGLTAQASALAALRARVETLEGAIGAFLTKYPAQIGSKSNREDYGSFVTAADLWALHSARAALSPTEATDGR